ncbi:MAG: shikimate dehydrogenase family protein [Acetivibrionales bacterium]|jgi:shikimate dehydrogenase
MAFTNLKCNHETRIFPQIGYPLGSIAAPYVYNPLLERFNINEICFPVEIKKENLGRFIDVVHTLDIKHFIVTMPHKKGIVRYLDEVQGTARLFGCVCIVKVEEGRLIGKSTEAKGAINAMRAHGTSFSGKEALVMGAGSIVGPILYQLAEEGVKKTTIVNIILEEAEQVAKIIRENTSMAVDIMILTPENLDKASENAELFLQCTPLGMGGFGHDHKYLRFMDRLPKTCSVLDVVGNPPETKVIKRARELGLTVTYGMDMLIAQAVDIFEFCFGITPKEEDIALSKDSLRGYVGNWGE